MNDLVLKGLP